MTASENPADRDNRTARGARRPVRVIEGEAVVTARRPLAREPGRPAAGDGEPREMPPLRPAAPRPGATVLLRERVRAPRDLVFQGALFGRVMRAARSVEDGAARRSIFGERTAPANRVSASVAAGFAISAALLIPAVLLAAPEAPVAATLATNGASPLTLSDVSATIQSRGAGEVLSVEGMIENATSERAVVPPLRIALSDDHGFLRAKPVTPALRELAPGAKLRFQTMVAMPAGTSGDVSVEFTGGVKTP